MGINGEVSLENMTVDATDLNTSWNALILDLEEGSSTLVLADNVTVLAPEDQWAVASPMLMGDDFTVIIDPTSKIVVSGENGVAILAQGWAGSTVNVVLNGSADDCFDLSGGAVAFDFCGNDGDTLTVNMFVKSDSDMAQYAGILRASDVTVNWYVNGTLATTQHFAA